MNMKLFVAVAITVASGSMITVAQADNGSRGAEDRVVSVQSEKLDLLLPRGASSKTLTMPLGNDGTVIEREFTINQNDRMETLQEMLEWRDKAETLAPLYETEESLYTRSPGASCNGANTGSTATETTNYSNPTTNMCWTETSSYVCTQTGEGSAGISIFGFNFFASAPVYGWVQSTSSSTAPQLCP